MPASQSWDNYEESTSFRYLDRPGVLPIRSQSEVTIHELERRNEKKRPGLLPSLDGFPSTGKISPSELGSTATFQSNSLFCSRSRVEKVPITKKEIESRQSFYDLEAKGNSGGKINFGDFKGKVVLIVNVASECGFTSQYAALESLYRKYKDQGFVIVGFPCNQFGGQESGSDEEIHDFCVKNFGVTFPLTEKVEVNGKKEHDVYRFLKKKKQLLMGRIKWNFEKFLIDKHGEIVGRFSSLTTPASLEKDVQGLLGSSWR
eukprot:TRINITY_DN3198_c0_g1_i1.p1 TRINITY_DN3198_c0_g1~~TRINITY_DN3198_c0_g1_i1.p1  ORF type:complete len:260 (-),score=67.07 TRINITY_DN3198_c0_g1_i1:17-796(-)